jgi:hypothetical protein
MKYAVLHGDADSRPGAPIALGPAEQRHAPAARGSRPMSRLFSRFVFAGITVWGLGASSLQAQEHGDHNPHHGGVVLMYGLDLHYELVLTPAGKVELWLSNAARDELPASIVSDIAVEIEHAGQRQNVDMAINQNGDAWTGQGAPVKADGTSLHLGFVFRGESATVSFPATSLMGKGRENLVKDTAHAPSAPAPKEPKKTAPEKGHEGHSMGHEAHSMPAHESQPADHTH